jgi:hypothetical protein
MLLVNRTNESYAKASTFAKSCIADQSKAVLVSANKSIILLQPPLLMKSV